MNIAAIIPIKNHSSRIPGKNFKLLDGKPLFYYIINTLLSCENIKYIILNTDNVSTNEQISAYFNSDKIIYYDRPYNLIGDEVSTNKLIADTIENNNLDIDLYIQTHVTNPLISKETIILAIDTFLQNNTIYDSLFTVKSWHTRLYDSRGLAINHDPNILIPTQDLSPLYEENSCLYIFTRDSFMKTKMRIGRKPYLFEMNSIESQDIDWIDDFRLAELMMERKNNKDKVMLISGINGGIGSYLGNYFKEKGWYVIGLDIQKSGDANCNKYFKCDLANETDIINVTKNIPILNIIINNAAYQLCKPLIHSSVDEWDRVMNTNLRPVFLLAKHLHQQLKNSEGGIINIASVHATHTSKDIGIYATSKGGMVTLTRSMAIEYGQDSIRVNAILPGAINTGMLRAGLKRGHFGDHSEQELIDELGKKHILGRLGDIARMAEFLADNNKSSFITGQSYYVDGGATIRLSTE
jgi:CMP-N-acetylneuraminic acid synthetase/NAD(P)-dependent dehydrogenase (short-subunit alcohol dehydrogenase family)